MILMTALVDGTTKARSHEERRHEGQCHEGVRLAGPRSGPTRVGMRAALRRRVERTSLRVFVPSWFVFDKRGHENQWRLQLIVLLLVLASACGGRDPIRATTIQLGRSINPDNTVSGHTTRFKPDDTIYASVLTTGSGSATISARWTYAGRVVGEPRRQVRYRGDAATEFHIQNNGGFPVGDYSVELFVDGVSVGARDFRIEK